MIGVKCDLWCPGWDGKISKVGRSKTQDTPPDHGTNTQYDPLLEGQPVEYIKHVGRYVSQVRKLPDKPKDNSKRGRRCPMWYSRRNKQLRVKDLSKVRTWRRF